MLIFSAVLFLGATVCQAAVLGGYRKLDRNLPEAQSVLSFVESSINLQSNDMYSSRMTDVFDVQRQLVNGVNYKVEFEFSRTGCSKMSLIALETCPLSGRVERCMAKVYKPFTGEMEMDGFACKPVKSLEKRAGQISGPVDNPELFRDEALKALSISNALLDTSKEFKVLEVRTQVVQGLMTYMKIQGEVDGVPSVCDLSIWSRPWLDDDENYQVSAPECKPVELEKGEKETRALIAEGEACAGCVGDEKPVDKDTLKLFSLALASYDDENLLSTIDLENTEFISMRTQVVAGIKYYIKLRTQSGGKTQMCEVQFVNAPWMSPANQITGYTCQPQEEAAY